MNLDEAQNVAFRLANLHSEDITLLEIRYALLALANFYEDNKKKVHLVTYKNEVVKEE